MSNVQSYNALIDRFKAFASGHFILKSFSHGQIDTADLEKFTQYPFMHVVPSNVTYAQGTKTFSFQIVLADLPRDKDDKVEFQREVLSDLQRIAEDLVAEITNHRVLFGDLITVQNVSLEPFLEEFHNTLTGWTVSLELLVPYYWDACSIPAEWNDMFESGSGGTGSILTFIDSITRDEYGNVSLVNDEANPAPNYYYGTNDEGVRGWYLLTDEVGLTCATIGTCQTIIDIESAIDDLQTEIALKGDMFKSVYDTDVDGVVDSAERIQIVVRNSTGSTLTKGQIVYLSGATGNRPNAVLAQANTEATSSKTIGMVVSDIANNADGQIAVNGTLHDLDTSAFTAGDTLWLSATTAGGMVANTPPSEPNHAVFIGYVARSHPNLGRVVLAIQNGYELDELHGVQITTPANNEVLTYESSTSLWKNKTVETALGYTPVPTTRSITINGTTQDLSADRTFSVGTFNLPSLTNGSVLFSNGTTIAQDNANLFWDDTNNRLGIGTNAPTVPLEVNGSSRLGFTRSTDIFVIGGTATTNTANARFWSSGGQAPTSGLYRGFYTDISFIPSSGSAEWYGLDLRPTINQTGTATGVTRGLYIAPTLTSAANFRAIETTAGNVLFGASGTGFFWDNTNSRLGIGTASPSYALDVATDIRALRLYTNIIRDSNANAYINNTVTNAATTDISIGNATAASITLTSKSAGKFVFTTGNVLIGTTTDAGYRLDVNGTARVSGTTTITPATLTGTAATSALDISQTWNTTGTPIAFKLNITDTASAALSDLISLQVGGSVRFRVLKSGFFTHNTGGEIAGNLVVGGSTIDASSQLEVRSTTKGFLPPRMTTTQKNAIATPAAGLVVYDTTLNKLCVRTAAAWETITSI